jgi:DNA-binding transcriptional LysR family regulator
MNNHLLTLPPLDAIRGFVAVVRRMSITLAAQDLCLTQSAVSRQVQALEEHLGTPLLIRKHRAIELTEAGERLYQLAAPWLERLGEYTQSLKPDGRPRPVTITTSNGVASLWILPRLGAFQALHPLIDVRVAASNRIMDMRQEGIDLAIRYCREADAPKDAMQLFDEVVVPVANPSIAARAFRSQKSLLDEVLLEFDERARPWLRWSDWLSAVGLSGARPRATLHFNEYSQVIQAAMEGHGVALGRLALVSPMLNDGRLVAHTEGQFGRSAFAYWLIQASDPPREEVRLFADWIIDEARRDAMAHERQDGHPPARLEVQPAGPAFREPSAR